jgi:hypothetical protein
MPEAARVRPAKPPAGTALAPEPRCAFAAGPFTSENHEAPCKQNRDKCQYISDKYFLPFPVRRRPGIVANSELIAAELAKAPDQRCTTSCCTASGERAPKTWMAGT